MDQVTYLQGYHRSGWPFVLRHLLTLQNDNGVLCDAYVDRTFLWAVNYGLIPYTTAWIGFIHHTFNTTFSDYNAANLLRNTQFLASLQTCKGLIVFSTAQRDKWISQLSKIGVDVPVESYIHPTEFVDDSKMFTVANFKANSQRMVVQIGAWLRDNYAIYRLNNGKSTFTLENGQTVHKAALIGPKMQQYYKPLDFFRFFRRQEWKHPDLTPPITDLATAPTSENELSVNAQIPSSVFEEYNGGVNVDDGMCRGDQVCRDIFCRDSDYALNKYVVGAVQMLKTFDSSVISIPTLSDDDYDTLLSENVVFVSLIDAAAVNTIQECIVRNTPLFVNPLPAVVEVLGPDYPLYFTDISQVPSLMTLENITAAHEYMASMDKTLLDIDTFMNNFTNGLIYSDLP